MSLFNTLMMNKIKKKRGKLGSKMKDRVGNDSFFDCHLTFQSGVKVIKVPQNVNPDQQGDSFMTSVYARRNDTMSVLRSYSRSGVRQGSSIEEIERILDEGC